MSRWGLVLSGGGAVGAAWYAGLSEGLATRGVFLGHADVLIGTSAGAWAGAWLASGQPPGRFIDALRRRRDLAVREADSDPPDHDLSLIAEVYSLLGGASAPLDPDTCRQIGDLAQRVRPKGNDPDWYPKAYRPYLPSVAWPERFYAVTVNADTGRVRLVGVDDRIPLHSGVAASCAAPGIVSPVPLDDGRYMDGGARSPTSADLVAGFVVDRCIVASPVPPDAPMIGAATVRVLEEEIRRLTGSGVEVTVVGPTDIERNAFGFDLLNVSKVDAAIEAGLTRGSLEADRLR